MAKKFLLIVSLMIGLLTDKAFARTEAQCGDFCEQDFSKCENEGIKTETGEKECTDHKSTCLDLCKKELTDPVSTGTFDEMNALRWCNSHCTPLHREPRLEATQHGWVCRCKR